MFAKFVTLIIIGYFTYGAAYGSNESPVLSQSEYLNETFREDVSSQETKLERRNKKHKSKKHKNSGIKKRKSKNSKISESKNKGEKIVTCSDDHVNVKCTTRYVKSQGLRQGGTNQSYNRLPQ